VSTSPAKYNIPWTPADAIDSKAMVYRELSQRQLSRIEYFEFGYLTNLTFIFGKEFSLTREKCPVGATYERKKQEGI
jgi:hypothetical protein